MADTQNPGRGRVGLARVTGDSMRPTLQPGDRLMVRYGARVRPGDLVLARFPDGVLGVKRVEERRVLRDGTEGWWLLSDNPHVGVDSRHRGPVPAHAVAGVVLLRVWPRPGRLRTRVGQGSGTGVDTAF